MIRASHFYFLTGCRNSHQWRLSALCGGTVHQYAAIVRRQDDRWRDKYHHCRSFADTSINLTSKIEAFYARYSVERNLLLVLNRIKQLSQVNSCFSQLRMNPGDFRGNIPRLADEMGQGLRDRSDRCLRWPFNSGLRNSEKTAALNESR
jgi:hypothetical protein